MNCKKRETGGGVNNRKHSMQQKVVHLFVVVVLVEFRHEIQQTLLIAAENLKHLNLVRSKPRRCRAV